MESIPRLPSLVLSSAGIAGRAGSTLCAAEGGSLIVLGGADRTGEHFGDAFYVDLLSGSLVEAEVSGTGPPKCGGHASLSLAAGSGSSASLIVFGGIDFVEEEVYNDVFEANIACSTEGRVRLQWRRLDVGGPRPDGRTGHTLTPVLASTPGVEAEAVLFGGCSPFSGPLQDAHVLLIRRGGSGSEAAPAAALRVYEWAALTPTGEAPAPREMHHAFFRPAPDAEPGTSPLLVIVGGRGDEGAPLRSLHALDLRAQAWLPAVPTPHAVVSAAGVATHGGLVQHLYGGWAGDTALEPGVVTLDTRPPGGPAAWSWSRALLSPPRLPRFAACAAMVVLGPSAAAAAAAAASYASVSELTAELAAWVGPAAGAAVLRGSCDAPVVKGVKGLTEGLPAGAVPVLLAFGGMAAEADLSELVAIRLPEL